MNISNAINYETMFMKGIKEQPADTKKETRDSQVVEKKQKSKKKKNFDDEHD